MFFLYGMENYALIVAGGSGARMGGNLPKQFLLLHNKPLLWYSIKAFQSAFANINIVLVLPENHLQEVILQNLPADKIKVVAGGMTRFHSVKNGLEHVSDNSIVFVHDGVRCLLSKELILRCHQQTSEKGSAIPVVKATDSLRIDNADMHSVIDRMHIRLVQTPQTFISQQLKAAFAQPYQDSFTDEATVMEASGNPVYLIEGEYENIKITRPLDLLIAEAILAQQAEK